MSKNKTRKSNTGYEKLVKCVTQSATSSLQQAVLRKQDRYPELYTEVCLIDVTVAKELTTMNHFDVFCL